MFVQTNPKEFLQEDREKLITDNINYVHYILNKVFHVTSGYPEYEDYFQEGCIGLVLAAVRFDESKGFKFSTYAMNMIIGSIRKYRRNKQSFVSLPRAKYSTIMKILQMSKEGCSTEEIKKATEFTDTEIHHALLMCNVSSLDVLICDGNSDHNRTVLEEIDNNSDDYAERDKEENISECIEKVSETLKNDLQKAIWEEWIWTVYYGEKPNQYYLADKYKVSQSFISKVVSKGKTKFVELLNE